MSNRFFAIVLVVIALFFGGFLLTKGNDAAQTGDSTQASNHVRGEGKSGVVLIEYGDFQCPACGSYFPVVEQVVEKHKDQITFKFVNFPLVQIHRNAFVAHRAAEAASKQNKFWEMYSVLYQQQDTWKDSTDPAKIFAGYAQQLSLNVDQFNTDMASSEVNDIINADIKVAQDAGATSTPTFVLDGKKLETNPRSFEDFSKLIEDAIKAKSQ